MLSGTALVCAYVLAAVSLVAFLASVMVRYTKLLATRASDGRPNGSSGKDLSKGFSKLVVSQLRLVAIIFLEIIQSVLYKAVLIIYALWFLLFSNEHQGFTAAVSGGESRRLDPKEADVAGRRVIVFIRHGESFWNDTFNRGVDLRLPFRILRVLFWESILSFVRDSVLFDSPLSSKGISQSENLAKWISDGGLPPPSLKGPSGDEQGTPVREVVDILRGAAKTPSTLVTSNLRRSISTILISCGQRLRSSNVERVMVLSCLQEATRNPDGLSLSSLGRVPVTSTLETKNGLEKLDLKKMYSYFLDPSSNRGSKSVFSRMQDRLRQFCDWAFEECSTETLIVCGHSIWLKDLFKLYMTANADHLLKSRKIDNCSVIRFEMTQLRLDGAIDYWIVPESFVLVHGKVV